MRALLELRTPHQQKNTVINVGLEMSIPELRRGMTDEATAKVLGEFAKGIRAALELMESVKVPLKLDAHGWPYARLSEVKEGDILCTDDGFPCMTENRHVVKRDHNPMKGTVSSLYITCKSGKHFLEGQADDGENLIGLYTTGERA